MKTIIAIIALVMLSACEDTTEYPYTVLHADGSYTRTNERPDGSVRVVCNRGPVRTINIINNETQHTGNVSNAEAQRICRDTIK